MGISSVFLSELAEFWPILAVGFLVFVVWYAGKAAARASGYHFGLLGVAAVVLVVAAASWYLGSIALAVGLGFIGAILFLVGLAGKAR
ncbi:MAG: hypothetical protein ACREC5_07125 [Thermoplasmata archaeon]